LVLSTTGSIEWIGWLVGLAIRGGRRERHDILGRSEAQQEEQVFNKEEKIR